MQKRDVLRHVDIVGKRFGRLVVLERIPLSNKSRNARWKCQCDCGNVTIAFGFSLKSGRTQSCGCYNIEAIKLRTTKHGQHRSKLYKVWTAMKQRCENPKDPAYPNYGGRGITVHPTFKNSFEAFAAELGPQPSPAHTLERRRNDGNYEPGNICWATRAQQLRNKRTNRMFTFNGETLCIEDWAKKLNVPQPTLYYRLKHWSLDKSLTSH